MPVQPFDYRLSLADVAPVLRSRGHLTCLDSAVIDSEVGRYSYAMAAPSLLLSSSRTDHGIIRTILSAPSGNGAHTDQHTFDCDPLDIASLVLEGEGESWMDADLPPFRGGWAGYIGYDFGAALHGVKAATDSVPNVPQLLLCWYNWVLAWDHQQQRAWVIVRDCRPDVASVAHAANQVPSGKAGRTRVVASNAAAEITRINRDLAIAARGAELAAAAREPARNARQSAATNASEAGTHSNFTRDEYMLAVQRVRDLILAGDIFQANIAQRFTTTVRGDTWQLYSRLREESPASHSAYLQHDDIAVLSASPEMFFRVDSDGLVETRPIKGTRPRGATDQEDERLRVELLASEKDRSENLMIVDLLRNDLSRACEPGSVFVPELFRVERMSTVQHLVSAVRGKLQSGCSAIDLFRACFPGGSITGAPKTRAIQVIAEIEGTARGVYCGAIGYFAADGCALFNVAIRTITVANGVASFSAGGGIVLDSDPLSEYAETMVKAEGARRVLG